MQKRESTQSAAFTEGRSLVLAKRNQAQRENKFAEQSAFFSFEVNKMACEMCGKLDKEQVKDLKSFIKSLEDRDFTLGDTFWIDDIQFKVTKFSDDYFGDEK